MRHFHSLLIALLIIPTLVVAQDVVGYGTGHWKWTPKAAHHDSIVKVSVDGKLGTGVVVKKNESAPSGNGYLGYVATAYHVVQKDEGKNKIRIVFRNGKVARKSRIVEHDEDLDVAILWTWIPADIPAAKLAKHSVQENEVLEFSGLGGGSKLDCCVRHFESVSAEPTNEQQIFSNVSLLPGDSGGPIFNERQELVGVISGGWFWFYKGVTDEFGTPIKSTWPARAANASIIYQLVQKATSKDDEELEDPKSATLAADETSSSTKSR
jgi:hypothetical protein